MHPAILYRKLKNKAVQCGVCQRRCKIDEGQIGFCKTRVNQGGKLYTTIYDVVSSCNNDPIEKKPVFHYQPRSLCLSLGTFGCNFRCKFCQNWDISYADASKEKIINGQQKISPKQAVKMAFKLGSKGIAWTYNEPAIWLEYSLDCAKLAKSSPASRFHFPASILYTCWVTNGYATKEVIDLIAPYLDIYRVDLKSFEDKFYQKLIAVPKAAGVFEVTKYIHDKYPKIHLECVTNIIPGWNDDKKTLKEIAVWILKNLGPKIPWHVTRFYPAAQMMDVPPTPAGTLIEARKLGFKAGLEFVYIGNLATETGENTYCPKCKTLNIRRSFYQTEILAVDRKGCCSKCGEDLNLKF